MTIGIYGGNPDWMDINISAFDKELTDSIKGSQKKLGFIKFTGLETLFVLDGQHRLKGLREAYSQNPEKIENDEIVCTLIIHKPDSEGRIKTRRLFSTINRQAKPVSKGENILLDEDDASSIMVRELVENYKEFKNKEIIALSKGANISIKDFDKFTTVVTLWTINEKLIDKGIYHKIDGDIVRTRPTEKVLNKQKTLIFKYWDKFFSLFPSAKLFINKPKEERTASRSIGGDFILRPIAQTAIFEILEEQGVNKFESESILKLKDLPSSVTNEFWAYILWNPFNSTMLTNRSLVRNYIRYNVGLNLKPSELQSLKDKFKSNSGDKELSLLSPRYVS